MKDALLTVLIYLALWSLVSVVAGMLVARVLGRQSRSLAATKAAESEGEPFEGMEPIPVEQWPQESIDSLYTAISEPEFVESVLSDLAELEVYEGEERV